MPPSWAMLLSMTNGNLIEAMELENTLTEEWFFRYQAWSEETKPKKK